MRWHILAVLLPLSLAAALRLHGIKHGVEGEFIWHPDVMKQVRVAMYSHSRTDNVRGMFKGDYRMELYPYGMSMLVGRLAWWQAWWTGRDLSRANSWTWTMKLRKASVLFALAGIALLLVSLRRAFRPAGLALLGWMMAAEPIHSQLSHYGMNDVPLLTILVAVWLVSSRMDRDVRGLAIHSMGTGFLLGLAFGIKYQALLAGLFPLCAWIAHTRNRGGWWMIRSMAAFGFGGLAGLLLTCPMVFLKSHHFWVWFPVFMRWQSDITGLNLPLIEKLADNVPQLAECLVSDGRWLLWLPAAWTIRRGFRADTSREERFRVGSAALFIGLLCATLVVSRDLVRVNDVLPVIAFLIVAAAWAVERVEHPVGRRLAATACLIFAAVSTATAALDSHALTRPDTRARALEWCRANIPEGSVVRREQYTLKFGDHYVDREYRYLALPEVQRIIREGHFDYLITSSLAYNRFFDPEFHGESRAVRRFYQDLPRRFEEVVRFRDRKLLYAHPEIRIFRNAPPGGSTQDARE